MLSDIQRTYQRGKETYPDWSFVDDGFDEAALPMGMVAAFQPKLILEIGTGNGGWSWMLMAVAAPNAELITFDIGVNEHRESILQLAMDPGKTTHFFSADSRSPQAIAKVEELLVGRQVDLLFIDGDHNYEAVKSDIETFSKFVRHGGLILLHDARLMDGPRRALDEFRSACKMLFYSAYGVGVAVKTEESCA